jgi:hypothetical protein
MRKTSQKSARDSLSELIDGLTRGHWWLWPVAVVVSTVAGTLFFVFGQAHVSIGDDLWLLGGVVLLVIGGGLQYLREISSWSSRKGRL